MAKSKVQNFYERIFVLQVLFIADEIQTGLGRTGKYVALGGQTVAG